MTSEVHVLKGNSLNETMDWLKNQTAICLHDGAVLERDNGSPDMCHIYVDSDKTDPHDFDEKKYARLLKIVSERNNDLETEVGRLTMINRAYEEQFADMRKAIRMLELESHESNKQDQGTK